MTDSEILQQLVYRIKNDDSFSPEAREEYEKLVVQFPEDGFEIEVPDDPLSIPQEDALRDLTKSGYIKLVYSHKAHGWIYTVDLRGHEFVSLRNRHQCEMVNPSMHDSGKRETFSTGAVRDTAEGKPRPDLISPFAMERLAEWLRLGAEKYTPRNWEAGLPVSRCIASLCRHLMKLQQGSNDEDHVAAIMCNGMFIAHIQEMVKRGVLPDSLLDMPSYTIPRIHQNKDEPIDY